MIQAVVCDYGFVQSGPRAQWAIDAALAATGLQRDVFEDIYWKFRDVYDAGALDDAAYWRKSLESAGIAATPELVAEMLRLDVMMWCTTNDEVVAWLQRLHGAGIETAILSNMGEAVRAAIERECAWLHAIDFAVGGGGIGDAVSRRVVRKGFDPGIEWFSASPGVANRANSSTAAMSDSNRRDGTPSSVDSTGWWPQRTISPRKHCLECR